MSDKAEIGNQWLNSHWMIQFRLSVALSDAVMTDTGNSNWPGYDTHGMQFQ